MEANILFRPAFDTKKYTLALLERFRSYLKRSGNAKQCETFCTKIVAKNVLMLSII